MKLGGVNDPEEHEAEHAASVIASGGCYQLVDPGGSTHLRAASAAAPDGTAHEPVRKSGGRRDARAGPQDGGRRRVRAGPQDGAKSPRMARSVPPSPRLFWTSAPAAACVGPSPRQFSTPALRGAFAAPPGRLLPPRAMTRLK